MAKRIIEADRNAPDDDQAWLVLDESADIELTSEDPRFPIEKALSEREEAGWRAGAPGKQVIRLIFHQPRFIRSVRLSFEEPETERTQEYCLRWSKDENSALREILRQQWNFSPNGSTTETERHQLNLPAVKILELTINPDIGNDKAFASLKQLKIT